MPRKPARVATAPTHAQIRNRVQAAVREHRWPQALELAKQLLKQEPAEKSQELLRDVYQRFINHHFQREAMSDATRLLDEAERSDGPATWWESLAIFRAKLGDHQRARRLLEKAPGSAVLPRVMGFVVDRAMADRQRGRDLLPSDLRSGFDLIRNAFEEYDRGNDEAARQALQAIGLQSPYLDWKLLIRGLIAYSSNDDGRAMENWQRLDAERLPAKLAAAFRFQVDPTFRNTLKADNAARIGKQADVLSHPMLGQLRNLQRSMGTPEELPHALRQSSPLIGMMKMTFPHLVPKLANCFYWLIIQGGQPNDLDRYKQLFGAPADDKNFSRLQAMVVESGPGLDLAHMYWQKYAAEIAASPDRWPGEHGKRARAMILQRMGANAQQHLDEEGESPFEEVLSMLMSGRGAGAKSKPKQLQPSVADCYRQAMDLAPDWKEPAKNLLKLFEDEENRNEAEAVARKILERFPDDIPTLMSLSSLQLADGNVREALDHIRQALKANPLDRTLRTGAGVLCIQSGRPMVSTKRFDEARAAYREATEFAPDLCGQTSRAALAALEYKVGDVAKAEGLVAELLADPGQRLAALYRLLVEFGLAKLSKTIAKEQQTKFESALREAIPAGELESLITALSAYRQEKPAYRGIGTHEKKILASIQARIDAKPDEEALLKLGFLLLKHKYLKLLKVCAEQGKTRFRGNPCFSFLLGEQAILQKPQRFGVQIVGDLFRDVLRLTEGKNDERSRMLREKIEERLKQHPDLEYWAKPRYGRRFESEWY